MLCNVINIGNINSWLDFGFYLVLVLIFWILCVWGIYVFSFFVGFNFFWIKDGVVFIVFLDIIDIELGCDVVIV